MPLHDHFRDPINARHHWEAFHATWPVMIVAELRKKLPNRYYAEPRVHSGASAKSDVYEVQVYDRQRNSRLVAAVEIVSPANKDRPDHRDAFVGKCAGLLRELVSVVIVDIVTTRSHNLYVDLLELLRQSDPDFSTKPSTYAAACRMTKRDAQWHMESWAHKLSVGQPLPTMPLWLADDLAVPLEFDNSYEQSCEILDIPAIAGD